MQARYPKHIVVLVEDLVGPLRDDAALDWMQARAKALRAEAEVGDALAYIKERSSGTMSSACSKPQIQKPPTVISRRPTTMLRFGHSESEASSSCRVCREPHVPKRTAGSWWD